MRLELLELDKKTLLKYVTEEQIFCRYLEIDSIDFKKQYKNPLRRDESAGCTFYIRDSDNRIVFNDWSKGWVADCFDVAMKAYSLSFPKTLEQIAIDFNIINGQRRMKSAKAESFKAKVPLVLRVNTRNALRPEINFWNIGGFTVTEELLNANKIYTIGSLWELRGEEVENHYTKLKMTYAFKFPGKWKYQIYRPEIPRNRRRFINTPQVKYGDLEFQDKEANYIVITKSKKDAFFLRLLGVNVFFIITETVKLEPDLLYQLQQDYEFIFTLFDNDPTGKRQSVIYKQAYGTIPLLYPKDEGKDTYEVLSFYGKQFMFDRVDYVKQKYYL